MNRRPFFLFFAALLLLAFPTESRAQAVDIIRGRVLGPDTLPLPNVTVVATTLTGQVSRTARTDRNGRYQISFPGGEGDYWITFQAVGFQMRRYQVKRTADQEILIADARLTPATVTLEAVTIAARPAAARSDTISDVSGNERTVGEELADFVSAEQLGDLAAMAAAIPGVQLIPGLDGAADAFSVFGLDGDQNNTQLNGLAFGDGSIPRDANVFTSLSTSPYDVSRGGFSGGQIQIRTRPGSNFYRRNLSSNLITPQMQWLDPRAVATGAKYTTMSLGGSASGPFRPDVLFYNSSFQFDRRLQDQQSLISASDLGLETIGVAPDSVQRLFDVLNSQQAPYLHDDFVSQYVRTYGSFLGSFDFIQPNSMRGNTFTLSVTGNVSHSAPVTSAFGGGGFGGGGAGSSLFSPSRFGTSLNWSGSAQLRHSGQLGIWGIFSESNVGFGVNRRQANPFYTIPSASVRVASTLDDGTTTVNNVYFGGSPSLNTKDVSQTISGTNTLNWFSNDNRHRVKLTTELRHDSYSRDLTGNQYGSFSFNSLEDLENNRPASFTRQLAPRRRDGSQLVGAVSLGDAWRPTNDLQVQYGLRFDANKYLTGPAENPKVNELFGRNNADVPSRMYLSPRVGFSWTYGSAQQVALLPGQARIPRAVVRGGVGVFQNAPGVQLIGGAIDNTGLPSGLQQLVCLGEAAPVPNWSEYLVDQATIPVTCADGTSGTVFSNSTPNVTLFDPDYAAQRSIRGNLQWSGAILNNRFAATVDGTVSRNQHQQGNIDLNFLGTQGFTLDNEAGRPVFVNEAAIVPSTGQVAWRESRVNEDFGQVTQVTSNLQSESKQVSLSIRPISFNSRWGWNLTYVLSDVRQQFLGFNSTVGDPRTKEWSPGSFSRHTLQGSLRYSFLNDAINVSAGMSIRSGQAYTPGVDRDINGDSYRNDRAYIFDPNDPNTDPVVAEGIQGLLNSGTREAAACLRAQLGTLSERNSCMSPWTFSVNSINIRFNSLRIGLPQRANLSFQVSNPLSGIDQLINGTNNMKGWGQGQNFDRTLLYVRGYNPQTNSFEYDVNQRFGSTRPQQNARRNPVAITMRLGWDIGPTRERQTLLQQLDRGRTRPGNRPSLQQLRGTANIGLLNPMQQILQQSDSLKLTRQQADSLTVLNRLYVLTSDSIWMPTARFLSELPDRYDHDLAYDRYRRAREQSVDVLIRIVPGIKGVLTPEQWRMLPESLQGFMDKRYLRGLRSGSMGR